MVTQDRSWKRPDVIDLIGPDFDYPSTESASQTLVICSARRTGSYELCRYLVAAGIGVPHEYFHENYAHRLATRWSLPENPLSEAELPRYLDLLRRRRAQGGVFATKLQFAQFQSVLRNRWGAALFDEACVVHLVRPDVTAQYASLRASLESGIWDFSPRQSGSPRVREAENSETFFTQALSDLDTLVGEDAGFRRLFVLLGIRPIFVTTDELFQDPRNIVLSIAQAMSLSIHENALERAIACSAPYGRDKESETAVAGLAERFRRLAFEK